MNYRRIQLTPAERELVAWAKDPMDDFWRDTDERSTEGSSTYDEPVRLTADGCEIVDDTKVLDDLRYRLLEQIPDMHPQAGRGSPENMAHMRGVKFARSAYEKVAAAFKGAL